MTKGKIPTSEDECQCEIPETRSNVNVGRMVNQTGFVESSSNTCSTEIDVNQNIVTEINIAEYVQNLPDFVRNKIAGFFGRGIIEQDLIDIENIEHYLIVSRHSNPLKSVCESKLLSTLNSDNCLNYLNIAERFGLALLKNSARQVYENNYLNTSQYSNKHTEHIEPTCTKTRSNSYQSYRAVFTCDTTSTKRTVSTVVFNSAQEVTCYRNIKKGDKISKQFQCCCLQDDEEHPPYVFWSFGKCFCRYDPILNKYKKMAPLRCSRSNFCLMAHNQRCYVIGGVCKGKTVSQIEEYDPKRKSWKIISELPVDCQMTYSSCVVFHSLIYIFCAATSKENCSQNRTVVCVFDPATNTVNLKSEIPMSFNQIKACVVDSKIYLASDEGDFIRYCPCNGSYVKCEDQKFRCKDFGIYSDNGAVFLVGGTNDDGKCNNTIRKFCTVSNRWERLSQKLPDCMAVYGTCEIKIPKTCSVVPFYETKLFEIPLK